MENQQSQKQQLQTIQQTSGLAIASMVCGIVSLMPIPMMSIILGILGIVLSVCAKKDIINNNKIGSGFAKTGFICGIISVALYSIFFILLGSSFIAFLSIL